MDVHAINVPIYDSIQSKNGAHPEKYKSENHTSGELAFPGSGSVEKMLALS